jgi:hypothetical protein
MRHTCWDTIGYENHARQPPRTKREQGLRLAGITVNANMFIVATADAGLQFNTEFDIIPRDTGEA